MHFPSRWKSSSQHLYTLGGSLTGTPSPGKETIQDPQLWDDSQHRFSKGRGSAGRQRQGQQLFGLELSGLGVPLRDRRHTALARIIPLVSKHHSEAISRRPETKQQLPGPERHTSDFISSSLDPPCVHSCPVAFPLPDVRSSHQTQPARVRLATGQLNFFWLAWDEITAHALP